MSKPLAIDPSQSCIPTGTSGSPDPAAREAFYRFLEQSPESETMWAARQTTLRSWRSESRFQPYWPVIDQMLTVDFASYRHWHDLAETMNQSEDFDFDAWRRQRECDALHAKDHEP